MPGFTHLADALMKDNPAKATRLEQMLQTGMHCHDPLSFITKLDMAATTSGDSRGNNVQLSRVCDRSG